MSAGVPFNVRHVSIATSTTEPGLTGRLKRRLDALGATTPRGYAALTALSAAETTVLPVPLEAILIPLMLVNRRKAWWLGGFALLGCIIGALVGYAAGYFLLDQAARGLLGAFGYDPAQLDDVAAVFRREGFWAVLLIAVTPVPFQIALLAAGMAKFSLAKFMLAVLIARSLRYLGLAALVYWLGKPAQRLWYRHKLTAAALAVALIALAYGVTQWLSGLLPEGLTG